MKEQLYIEDKWKDVLTAIGFNSFDSFFKKNKYMKQIATEKTGTVYKITLPNCSKCLFLKVKSREQLRKMVRSFLRGKPYKAPVINEAHNIKFLKLNGFSTLNIAAWGYSKENGMVDTSFILTEEVKGEEFIELYQQSDSVTREKLYAEYGKLLGCLHYNRIDSYVRIQDLICDLNESGDIQLTMIDREVGSLYKKNYGLRALKSSLSHVFYEGLKRYEQTPLTYREGISFCRAYLKANRNIKLSPKELFVFLMDGILSFIIKRKSFKRLAYALPKRFLLWPYQRKKHLSVNRC